MAFLLALGVTALGVGPWAAPEPGPGPGQGTGFDLHSDLETLGSDDLPAFEGAWERLVAAGQPAAVAALEGWDGLGPAARVARARLLGELAGDLAGVTPLVPLLSPGRTPEPLARAALAEALGSPALAREGIRHLEGMILGDPARAVRAAALQALADSGEPVGAERLDALLLRLGDEERPAAARALTELPAARARVVRRVQEALGLLEDEGASRGAPEALRHHATLAALVRGYGRALAELPQGGRTAADRAPFLLLRSHPDPRVRAAGRLTLDRFLTRLVDLGEEERADECLALLAQEGISPREVLFRRARLALAGIGDAVAARDLARELLRTANGGRVLGDGTERGWLHYGLVLFGAAEFALGEIDAARGAFDRAAAVLRGLIREREDLRPSLFARGDFPVAPVGGAVVVDALVELGLLEVWSSLCALAEGEAVGSPAVLEPLRRAHILVLRAELLGLRTDSLFEARSLDEFLDRDLSPRRLLLVSRKLPGGAEGRFLDLQLSLGRALGTVVPQEVMGFERAEVEDVARFDVFLDDERFGLLKAISFAERESAERAWFARRGELSALARREDNPVYLTTEQQQNDPEYRRLLGLFQREQEASEKRQSVAPEERDDPLQRERLYPELREVRTPSLFALTLAGELRADGRSTEARELAQTMLRDLRSSTGQSALWNEWISARLELAMASAWMDEGHPQEAERAGLAAVSRLEALERSMVEFLLQAAGDPGRALGIKRQKRQTELLRADALLSLAVNANVRAKDPERALEFFEQAFELDDREFMRVLLACYRARSGRFEEARSVLRGVQPAPSLFYNLACTFALLGEKERALEYLRRELEENHPTPGALARQKDWARADPDLASLRGDARFERLTATD